MATEHVSPARIFRRGRRQEVTGLVVNDGLAVPRRTLRRFQTLLFQIDKDGTDGKRWGQSDDVLSSAMGFANFVTMVDPAKGAALKSQVQGLINRYQRKPAPDARTASKTGSSSGGESPPKTTPKQPAKKKWWKLF